MLTCNFFAIIFTDYFYDGEFKMNKQLEILKVTDYDKFKCIAEKCEFTCCSGWDINIDKNTLIKWKKDNDNIFKNIETRKSVNSEGYIIDKEIDDHCPFLDSNKLCTIVNKKGEDYLSLTCKSFPRIKNKFSETIELSLSCACPEVVEIINDLRDKLKLEGSSDLELREVLINIMKEPNIKLDQKLMISYQMLLDLFDGNINENEIEKYKNISNLKEILKMYDEIHFNIDESLEELNNLFLDITQDYKEVPILKKVLGNLWSLADTIDIEHIKFKWNDYKNMFERYNNLSENCIVSKIIGSCISFDLEDIVVAYEMIILEYILIRYAGFLNYCSTGKIEVKDIKDYIVIFSRVIGNNSEAVLDFINEGFEDTILEFGYLCFICLF